MSKKYIYYVLASITLSAAFISCKTQKAEINMSKESEISFNLGFSIADRMSGTYFDAEQGRDMFYFSDIMTNKCIKIYDTDLNFIKTIKLDKIPKLNDIITIKIISNDTIIMLGNKRGIHFYIDLLYICDFNGELSKRIDIPYTSEIFFDRPVISNDIYYNNKVYLKNKINDNFYYKNLTYENGRILDSLTMPSAYMVAIDLDSTNNIQPLFNNIYMENFEFGYVIETHPFYYIANNKLFLPIGHNGKLYIINLDTEKIENAITVASKYTEIGFNFKKYERTPEKIENSILDAFEVLWYNSGRVADIIWDKYRQLYYVVLEHHNPKIFDVNNKDTYDAKTFSLQCFDEKFNKKGEIKLSARDYYKSCILISPKGILIQSNTIHNDDYDKNIQKYTLFTISD